MLVRKCDLETAEALPVKDKKKLMAIVNIDFLEDEKNIEQVLKLAIKLSEKEQRHK